MVSSNCFYLMGDHLFCTQLYGLKSLIITTSTILNGNNLVIVFGFLIGLAWFGFMAYQPL